MATEELEQVVPIVNISFKEEEEDLQLSESTMAALLEFQAEQETRKAEFERLEIAAEDQFACTVEAQDISLFQEDWNLSQFWYTDKTTDVLADVLLAPLVGEKTQHQLPEKFNIAIISAPSVFARIWKHTDGFRRPYLWPASRSNNQHIEIPMSRIQIVLLEFDDRFNVYNKLLIPSEKRIFYKYDFNKPLELDPCLLHQFDAILVDPPFLSSDCQTKSAMTVSTMLKSSLKSTARVIACTGERMMPLILKLYPTISVCQFRPAHRNGLSNEFLAYATSTIINQDEKIVHALKIPLDPELESFYRPDNTLSLP